MGGYHQLALRQGRPCRRAGISLVNAMQPEVMFVLTPVFNLQTFPSTCRQVLGYSPLRASDALEREVSDAERFLSCLAAFRDPKAPAGYALHLLPHVSVSIFIVADDRDVRDILEYCSGMSFVTTETLARGILAAVVSGTLAQWRNAVVSGSVRETEGPVRLAFNKLRTLFRGAGLDVWVDYRTREADDHTLLLEYKPQR